MFGLIFKFFGIAFCMTLLTYLAASALRNARRLNTRIRQFKAEQEAQQNRPGALDPYAALAEISAERTQPEPPARQAAKRRR